MSKKHMEIQKIFSEIETGERLYSVILDEFEMRLFGNKAYRDFILKEHWNEERMNPFLPNESRIKMESRYNHGAIKGGIGGNTGASRDEIAKFLEDGGNAKETFKNGVNRDALSQASVIHDYRANNHQVAPEKSLQERLEQRRGEVRKRMEQKKAKASTPATITPQQPQAPSPAPQVNKLTPPNPGKTKKAKGLLTKGMNRFNKMGTLGKLGTIGVGAATVGGLGYGAHKMLNKKKENN